MVTSIFILWYNTRVASDKSVRTPIFYLNQRDKFIEMDFTLLSHARNDTEK